MDVIVTPIGNSKAWSLTDLLGRPMGQIAETSAMQFTIHPDGHALETMVGIQHGPFASLDDALGGNREAHPWRLPAQSGRGSTMTESNPNLTRLRD